MKALVSILAFQVAIDRSLSHVTFETVSMILVQALRSVIPRMFFLGCVHDNISEALMHLPVFLFIMSVPKQIALLMV